eukprot:CAMPEP_0202967110 /NCGR_PEP_ID=MMETSP1396-20130829/11873_1 /ASSEMBLY_ACC=CAM_ASM_000872 /TAXON_ID= /ORGANISM="Pseudokeronopsis sp., Strain Brazil" /LENGTH=50 /DNA_ID=CAMNT_0049691801 /DNA_START=452 /DNA_END=604 /DNA_ORIENTATION=+
MKHEMKKQKYNLNHKEDIEVLDIIKAHDKHLKQVKEGLEDNQEWLILREN